MTLLFEFISFIGFIAFLAIIGLVAMGLFYIALVILSCIARDIRFRKKVKRKLEEHKKHNKRD